MDMQGIQWSTRAKLGVLAAAAVVVSGGLFAVQQTTTGANQNLISLIASLNSTTSEVLSNTASLHHRVQNVSGQLEQLNRQSDILSQQVQTGENLANQLRTQVQLTDNGVSLMRNILERQKVTADLTRQIAGRSSQLQDSVDASAATLNDLRSAVLASLNGSIALQQQLNELLAEMAVSEDEFKSFGQVKSLLRSLPTAPLQDALNKVQDSVPKLGNSNPLGQLPGSSSNAPSVPGATNPLNAVDSLLPLAP
jgi:chromosome segregation ATPase